MNGCMMKNRVNIATNGYKPGWIGTATQMNWREKKTILIKMITRLYSVRPFQYGLMRIASGELRYRL